VLLSKTKKKYAVNFDMEILFNFLEGKLNLIEESYTLEKFLKTYEFFSDKKDAWLITGKRDYSLIIKMIRKKHPLSDRIRRKINDCSEFGIITAVSKRTLDTFSISFVALFERFFEGDDEVMAKFQFLLSYKKTKIALEDFQSTFKLFYFGLFISFLVFIIEIMNYII
jgi:hypothetical protein